MKGHGGMVPRRISQGHPLDKAQADQGVGGRATAGAAGESDASVLARKAARGRAERPQPLAMTPARALSLALARVAETLLALPLTVTGVRAQMLSLADLPEAIMDNALIAVLEGPGEALGVAALSSPMVAALTEVQTTGRLAGRPPAPRRPTRTDAALAAPFLDGALSAFGSLLEGIEGQDWSAGYRYASFLDDPRPLGLMLEDSALRGFTVDLVLGKGEGRAVQMVVALPAIARVEAEVADTPAGATAPPTPDHPAARAAERWRADLEESVLGAEVVLTAVLARLTLPASAVMGLHVGTCLDLPEDAIGRIRLESAGRAVADARLGQHRGTRALRLNTGDEAAAPRPMAFVPSDFASAAPEDRGGWGPPEAAPEATPRTGTDG